jgi:hypothetical protein
MLTEQPVTCFPQIDRQSEGFPDQSRGRVALCSETLGPRTAGQAWLNIGQIEIILILSFFMSFFFKNANSLITIKNED